MSETDPIPVVLFAYARPQHLARTLACLRGEGVNLLYAFSDGLRSASEAEGVDSVRRILRSIDWCQVEICERAGNLGLGQSILAGVTDVLAHHDAVVVFEDDLICVPGTYSYLCAALRRYSDDDRVMSVTGWTHARVTPSGVGGLPYFDGRAESLVWGSWRRSWTGMAESAETMMTACREKGIDVYRYGADLVGMAEGEARRNIWAVRFLYWHILNGGLCMRPPWSMVEHMGFDGQATNAAQANGWQNPMLQQCPPIPRTWPEPRENPECAGLWRAAYGGKPRRLGKVLRRARVLYRDAAKRLSGTR